MFGDEIRLKPIKQLLALRGIMEKRGDADIVPLAVHRILHHRQQLGAAHGGGDDCVATLIGRDAHVVIGAGDRYPDRHQPIEIADVALERIARQIVPRRIE